MKLYLINDEFYVVEKDVDHAILKVWDLIEGKPDMKNIKYLGEEGAIFRKEDRVDG